MNEKVNFIFYGEWIDYFKEMNDKEIAQTMRAIFDTVGGKSVENLKGISAVTYKVVKNQIERDVQKYREKCEKNKKNIEKRWQKDTDVIPTEYERNTNVFKKDTDVIPNSSFGTVKKSNKEKDKDKENVNEGESNRKGDCKGENKSAPARFQNPTIDEVKKVAKELGFTEKMAERFFYHYDANGWVQGKDKPIFSWVSALNSWAAKEHDFEKPPDGKKPYTERQYDPAALDALFE